MTKKNTLIWTLMPHQAKLLLFWLVASHVSIHTVWIGRTRSFLLLLLSVSFSQQNIVSRPLAAQGFKSKGTSRTTASDYLYGCDRARLCFSILLAITLSAVSVTANRAAAAKLNIALRRFGPSPIYFFFFVYLTVTAPKVSHTTTAVQSHRGTLASWDVMTEQGAVASLVCRYQTHTTRHFILLHSAVLLCAGHTQPSIRASSTLLLTTPSQHAGQTRGRLLKLAQCR